MGVLDFDDFFWISPEAFESYEWSQVAITKLKTMVRESKKPQESKERQLQWIDKFENEMIKNRVD